MTIYKVKNQFTNFIHNHLFELLKGQISSNWGACYIVEKDFQWLYHFFWKCFDLEFKWKIYEPKK